MWGDEKINHPYPKSHSRFNAAGRFMKDNQDILSLFHPLLARWFRGEVGRPTRVQTLAWPLIAQGGHVLVSAPTGSGKTLTAFLHALDQFAQGRLPLERTSILYVSPLKALNNDIQRNLLGPLARLREVFRSQGLDFPDVRVLTRSGDTPQSQRQRMLRRPPEILITTPESLNLLLSSRGGRSILTTLQTVILDEIHAVCGSKRGTHLITAVERLTDFSGEFQRIALSATVRPIDLVAEFVGGFALSGSPQAPVYTPRRVALVESQEEKEYRLKIRFPEEIETRGPDQTLWEVLSGPFREIIAANRSTLFFVKGRRMAEKITRMINPGPGKAPGLRPPRLPFPGAAVGGGAEAQERGTQGHCGHLLPGAGHRHRGPGRGGPDPVSLFHLLGHSAVGPGRAPGGPGLPGDPVPGPRPGHGGGRGLDPGRPGPGPGGDRPRSVAPWTCWPRFWSPWPGPTPGTWTSCTPGSGRPGRTGT